MTEDQQPSQQARRAESAIIDRGYGHEPDRGKLAEIIERETGVGELLEEIKGAAADLTELLDDHAGMIQDEGPIPEGWKSARLSSLINRLREFAEKHQTHQP